MIASSEFGLKRIHGKDRSVQSLSAGAKRKQFTEDFVRKLFYWVPDALTIAEGFILLEM